MEIPQKTFVLLQLRSIHCFQQNIARRLKIHAMLLPEEFFLRDVIYNKIKQMNKCSYDNIKGEPERKNIMKKTYKIDVDCANCANKMEEAAKNTAGVKDATVNFMMLKMIVEFEDGQDPKAVMKDVLKNCKKVEDDCEIYL